MKAIILLCVLVFGPMVWGFLNFMVSVGLF